MKEADVVQTVFAAKPELQRLLERSGNQKLLEYLRDIYEAPENPFLPLERKRDLIDAFGTLIEERLGTVARIQGTQTLEKLYLASTADHHGPLCHPFFSHIFLAEHVALAQQNLPAVIVLPCGSVSLDNSSLPRGLFFHDTEGMHRLTLFPLSHQHQAVLGAPAYKKEAVHAILRSIEKLSLTSEVRSRLIAIFQSIYGRSSTLDLPTFDEQITVTNYALAKEVPGFEKAELLYLPQEVLATRLLLTHLEQNSLIGQLLTHARYRREIDKAFEGVLGAHESSRAKGTWFLWGMRDGRRLRLLYKGETLVEENGAHFANLDARTLQTLLREKKLLPNMALTFIILSFYHGLRVGGGFSQINYLGDMKQAYLAFLHSVNETSEIPFVEEIPTNTFLGEVVLATLAQGEEIFPATLLDCILYATKDAVQKEVEHTTVARGIRRMMGEYYKILKGHYPLHHTQFFNDIVSPTCTPSKDSMHALRK